MSRHGRPLQTALASVLALLTPAATLSGQAAEDTIRAWSVTIDGATRTLHTPSCDLLTVKDDGFLRAMGNAQDDAGYVLFEARAGTDLSGVTTQVFEVELPRVIRLHALYSETGGAWTREGNSAPGPLFVLDGTRITGGGTFRDANTKAEHQVTFAIDCRVVSRRRGGS